MHKLRPISNCQSCHEMANFMEADWNQEHDGKKAYSPPETNPEHTKKPQGTVKSKTTTHPQERWTKQPPDDPHICNRPPRSRGPLESRLSIISWGCHSTAQ